VKADFHFVRRRFVIDFIFYFSLE